MSKISYIASGDRKYITSRILSLIKTDIVSVIKNSKKVLVKPYIYSSDDQLRSVHVDCLEAVLEFIAPYLTTQITIAADTKQGNTLEAFSKLGFFKLQETYDFAIVDLNSDSYSQEEISGQTIQLPSVYLESDYIISITPPIIRKSGEFSASIANILEQISFSSVVKPSKLIEKFSLLRNKDKELNPRLTEGNFVKSVLAQVPLHLSVIDAYSFSSAAGQNSRISAPHWASASIDSLANDYFACSQLGFETNHVSYFAQAIEQFDRDTIIVGDSWQQHRT